MTWNCPPGPTLGGTVTCSICPVVGDWTIIACPGPIPYGTCTIKGCAAGWPITIEPCATGTGIVPAVAKAEEESSLLPGGGMADAPRSMDMLRGGMVCENCCEAMPGSGGAALPANSALSSCATCADMQPTRAVKKLPESGVDRGSRQKGHAQKAVQGQGRGMGRRVCGLPQLGCSQVGRQGDAFSALAIEHPAHARQDLEEVVEVRELIIGLRGHDVASIHHVEA